MNLRLVTFYMHPAVYPHMIDHNLTTARARNKDSASNIAELHLPHAAFLPHFRHLLRPPPARLDFPPRAALPRHLVYCRQLPLDMLTCCLVPIYTYTLTTEAMNLLYALLAVIDGHPAA